MRFKQNEMQEVRDNIPAITDEVEAGVAAGRNNAGAAGYGRETGGRFADGALTRKAGKFGAEDAGEFSNESLLGNAEGEYIEHYEEFKLPEGINVDRNILALATEQFKLLGLSQQQAQGVVDLSPQITEAIRGAQQHEWDLTTSRWSREVRNDRELGGRNFKESIAKAERVLRRFDTDGRLREFLTSTRAGNNPDMIRFLVHIDGALSESSFGRMPAGGAGTEKSDAEIFFPEQFHKDELSRMRSQDGV